MIGQILNISMFLVELETGDERILLFLSLTFNAYFILKGQIQASSL